MFLSTGVSAGFVVSSEFHRFVVVEFYDRGNIAAGVLLVGTVCMAVVSMLSSIDRTSSRGFFLLTI